MKIPYSLVESISQFAKPEDLRIPLLRIEFEFTKYNCLIDSGANISHMHYKIGELLGLSIERGIKISSTGVDGISFPSYVHRIKFKVYNWNCEIDVAFGKGFNFPYGLLGRSGFFELFNIAFYQKYGFFEINYNQ
jgi:hypothetical protein